MRTHLQRKISGFHRWIRRAALALAFLLAGSGMAMAQGLTVTGRVTDAQGGGNFRGHRGG